MVKMDVSRKLYKEDIIILKEFELELLKRDIRITQKDLIDKCIKFAMEHKNEFFDYIYGNKELDDKGSNYYDIADGRKLLNKKDAVKIKKAMKEFRK